MNWMNCNTCKTLVNANNTGICLGCQRGFIGIPQEDEYKSASINNLKKREEEIEIALQKSESAGLPARQTPPNSEAVGKGIATKNKTTKKSKKEKRKIKND